MTMQKRIQLPENRWHDRIMRDQSAISILNIRSITMLADQKQVFKEDLSVRMQNFEAILRKSLCRTRCYFRRINWARSCRRIFSRCRCFWIGGKGVLWHASRCVSRIIHCTQRKIHIRSSSWTISLCVTEDNFAKIWWEFFQLVFIS